MAKDNGGPAFPVVPTSVRSGEWGYAYPGMTLRDWFAGMALAGMLANSDTHITAATAYDFADAMIAERNKED